MDGAITLAPLAYGSTLADIGGLIGGLATVGLLLAAVVAGFAAYDQVGQLKEQVRLTKEQLLTLTQQVETQRQTERRRRVYEHLGRLLDKDFIVMGTEAERLWRHRDQPDWRSLWNAKSDDEKAIIRATMNFYEIVAGEYNDPSQELLDRTLADKALMVITSAAWVEAKPFVRWIQRAQPRAYEEWEKAHERFTARQQPAALAAERAWGRNG